MKTSQYCLSALLVVLLQLTSCSKEAGKTDQAATVANDKTSAATISIASLTPDPNQPLMPGANIKLTVNADYVLPSKGGLIGVVIQGSDTQPIGSNLKDVPGGAGKFTREINFVVPKAKNIVVHVPLYIKGESKSAHVATKQYQIAAK
jgi:hypothetical protein